jgi:hypothetical protein
MELVLVKFQVLKAMSMKMAVFWVVAPCSLVEVYRRFKGAFCLHHESDEYFVLVKCGAFQERNCRGWPEIAV